MTISTILWGVLFGSIGAGFFIYGKKQRVFVPLLSGIALMIVPYFVSNAYLLITAGIALIVLPYFIRL